MKTKFVSVVYDRKKRVNATGEGQVELCIYLSRTERKFLTVHKCNPLAWARYQKSNELRTKVAMYQDVVQRMFDSSEEMTLANLNKHLGISPVPKIKKEKEKKLSNPNGFIDFMIENINKEDFSPGTKAHKTVAVDSVKRFGMINSFESLIPENIKAYDEFLHNEYKRTQTTINNYHKVLRKYTQLAFLLGYIQSDPYKHPLCRFSRGTSKERRPLVEDELLLIRNYEDFSPKLEHVRDLFIFCAYTGLSYSDSQVFDFKTMTEKLTDGYFIDGKRVKTGNTFFTPILPPAMEVLKKYDYQLPRITNQKANEYLYDIKNILKINKPLTMHVARHSFATLLLSNDVPLQDVSRMLGHESLKTTQIYAHILKSTIERHTMSLASKIR